MGMRTWITSLAAFGATVPGIHASYDLDGIPDRITRAMLPCLIPVPELGETPGLTLDGAMGGAPHDRFTVTHRLLFREAANLGLRHVLPDLVTQRDTYVAAAAAQRFLIADASPLNQVPRAFSIRVGVGTWGDTDYHLIDFTYRVKVNREEKDLTPSLAAQGHPLSVNREGTSSYLTFPLSACGEGAGVRSTEDTT